MKATLISDTHNQHEALKLRGGDLLIHAGDVSGRGSEPEVMKFLEWFSKQNYTYKIFIAGNHDFFFERSPKSLIDEIIPKEIIYLNDSGVEIEGIKIWGSPVQPWFFNWAFNRQRGDDIKRHWDLVPSGTGILITHGPPYGIMDGTARGEKVGCEELLTVVEKIRPKIHVFGHIHEGYGKTQWNGTDFYNASVLDLNYNMVNSEWNIVL
jgi:Icc-related predicted phosphoesterase